VVSSHWNPGSSNSLYVREDTWNCILRREAWRSSWGEWGRDSPPGGRKVLGSGGVKEGEDRFRVEGVKVALQELTEEEQEEAEVVWSATVVIRHAREMH